MSSFNTLAVQCTLFPTVTSLESMSTKCFSAKVTKAGIYEFRHHIQSIFS